MVNLVKRCGNVVDIFPVYITSYKQERQIRVYVPNNYEKGSERYPVLYMHDGQNIFQDEGAIGGVSLNLEKYLDEHELQVVVVAIDQNSAERQNEYCPWVNGEYSKKIVGHVSSTGGKGKQYVEFIVNELKPLIDTKYRTLPDRTAMAGISLGGLISTYAAARYPHIFKSVTVLSSAFFRNQEELENLLLENDLSLIERFYLDCGMSESDNEEVSKEFVASNKSIYDILKGKIPDTTFNLIEGTKHNYSDFRKRVPELFRFMEGSAK
jgi:predicted alpha/beta superfamily hydrolase